MAKKKPSGEKARDAAQVNGRPPHRRTCPDCGGEMILGELSSKTTFGVTRELHFVTSYKSLLSSHYELATEVESWMCLNCGRIVHYAQNPLAALDPVARQQYMKRVAEEMAKGEKLPAPEVIEPVGVGEEPAPEEEAEQAEEDLPRDKLIGI